jgi:hypothetical protein
MVSLDCIEEVIDFEEIQFPKIVKLCLYKVKVLHFSQLNEYPALSDLYLREVNSKDDEMIDCSRIQNIDVNRSYFPCLDSVSEIRDVSFSELEGQFVDPEESLSVALTHFDSIERLFLEDAVVFERLESDSLRSLISLAFKSCDFVDGSFDTSSLPSLVELFIEGCTDLKKLTLTSSSLRNFSLVGDVSSSSESILKLIEFQSPSLERAVVKNMTAVKSPIKCVLKNNNNNNTNNNMISNFIIENSSLHFLIDVISVNQ